MYLVQPTVKLAMLAQDKHERMLQTNDAYRQGWRDAAKGLDFIQEDMSFWYCEGVAIYSNLKEFNED